jgi:hypothetical protein
MGTKAELRGRKGDATPGKRRRVIHDATECALRPGGGMLHSCTGWLLLAVFLDSTGQRPLFC